MTGSVESSVPLSRLAEAVEYLQGGHDYEALKRVRVFIYGHVGTCDLHGMWVAPVSMPVEERARSASRRSIWRVTLISSGAVLQEK